MSGILPTREIAAGGTASNTQFSAAAIQIRACLLRVKMRLSYFQDAAANSRSAPKPDVGTSVRDKRIMLRPLQQRR
jgi:hypothetical protein